MKHLPRHRSNDQYIPPSHPHPHHHILTPPSHPPSPSPLNPSDSQPPSNSSSISDNQTCVPERAHTPHTPIARSVKPKTTSIPNFFRTLAFCGFSSSSSWGPACFSPWRDVVVGAFSPSCDTGASLFAAASPPREELELPIL